MAEEFPTANRPRFKLVVSDFHLGKGRYFADGTKNILEDFVYDREFADFLAHYRTGDFADADVEVILNGDILNLLQIDTYGVHTHLITERGVVRAVKRIIQGHPEFFLALRRWVQTPHHSVSYVIGNHDAGMLFSGAKRTFAEAVGGPVSFHDVSMRFDGIYVEHGQQYEHFARIDMQRPFITRRLPEPVLNLPWGSLFVAVLLPKIKQERPHVDKVRPFSAFLRWCAIHDPWWGFLTALRIAKFVFDTVLVKRRFQIAQGEGATLKLLASISLYPNYDKLAIKVLEDNPDINAVIFGHTHILKYRQWREGKEYFNEGTWNETTNLDLDDYGKQIRLTYAFIEYPRIAPADAPIAATQDAAAAFRPKVRLKQWSGAWQPEHDILV